jgi:hypothetical protein
VRVARDRLQRIIAEFELDLAGVSVLTEAATGPYALTACVAALANAESVVCLARPSDFASAEEAMKQTADYARGLGVSSKLVFADRNHLASSVRPDHPLIVTNLRGVRPLDHLLLSQVTGEREVIIAAMCEAWEVRSQDLDIARCQAMAIPVVCTDESHPLLQTIDRVGLLAVKLILEAGEELADGHVLVVGGGRFSDAIAAAVTPWARAVTVLPTEEAMQSAISQMHTVDVVVVADHSADLYQAAAWNDLSSAARAFDIPAVVISGMPPEIADRWPRLTPTRTVPPRVMTRALDAIGWLPVLRLHTAGLSAALSILSENCDRRPTVGMRTLVASGVEVP